MIANSLNEAARGVDWPSLKLDVLILELFFASPLTNGIAVHGHM